MKLRELQEQKQQDIIDAAIEEFRENSFSVTTMSKIAKRANVSSRTLYKHFKNKEELFDVIIERIFTECSQLPVVDFNPVRPIKEQLIRSATRYIDVVSGDEFVQLYRIATSEFIRDSELAKRTFAHNADYDLSIRHIIQQAMEANHLRKEDPFYASHQLIAMLKAFLHNPLLLIGEELKLDKSRDEVIEDCVDMFLAHYQ